MEMKRFGLVLLTLLATGDVASAQCSAAFDAGKVCGRSDATKGAPSQQTLTAMFDRAFCATNNSAMARISGSWTCLASANSGVWITSGAGVPSISSTLPTAVQDNITRVGTIVSGTWTGTDIAFANIAQGSALSVLGVTGNAPADLASIVAGTDGHVFRRSGTTVGFGTVDLTNTNATTGPLPVAKGGTNCAAASGTCLDNITAFSSTGIMSRTGAGTFTFSTQSALLDAIGSTRGSILYRGAAGWAALTPGTSGFVLTSAGAGADPSYVAAGSGTVTNVATGQGLTGGPITTTGTVAINLTTASNVLAADVLLNNTANFFDGPSMAQGTSGTWFASGGVTISDSTAAAGFFCKLWDGTTVLSSGVFSTGAAGQAAVFLLSGTITSPAANIRISCKDSSTVNGKIFFNASGASKDAFVYGIRIN